VTTAPATTEPGPPSQPEGGQDEEEKEILERLQREEEEEAEDADPTKPFVDYLAERQAEARIAESVEAAREFRTPHLDKGGKIVTSGFVLPEPPKIR
jgi:hypothetical protein